MTCDACTESAARQWFVFHADCQGCKARSVSRSPEFSESRTEGRQTPRYRALLARVGVTHAEAVRARDADVAGRK